MNAFVKTIVDEIGQWVKSYVSTHGGGQDSRVDGIVAKIPSAASADNQLADKAFVNSSVQTNTANFRGNWSAWANVPTAATQYPADYAGSKTPTTNDYMVVEDASAYREQNPLSGTWRFKYSGVWATNGKSGWLPEYQVNEEPLTSDQVAAINSGITAAKVAQIGAVAPLVKEVVNGDVATKYIDANKLYVFSERSADLAIDVTDTTNTLGIYVYQIEFGENVYGLDHPSVIAKWDGGSAPTPAANKTYEVSIMNGIAFWREV